MKKLLVFILLPCLLCGCGALRNAHYTPHPGAVDLLDSVTYDTLVDGKASLDKAKEKFANGQLPADAREYINQAVNYYNTADTLWLAYHQGHGNAQDLQAATDNFAHSIAALRQTAKVK